MTNLQAGAAAWIICGLIWLAFAGPKAYRIAKKNDKLMQFFGLMPTAVALWPIDAGISLLGYLISRSRNSGRQFPEGT